MQSGANGQIMGINLCSLSVSGMHAAQSNIQNAVADNAAQNNLQNSVVNNATQNNLQNGVVNNAAQNISTANIRMQDSVVEKLKSQTTDKAASSQKEYTLDEIKEFRKNPDISELFFIIETYLKHTLSSTDTNMVLYWLDELHFSTDLVEYLVEYCITKGHSSLRYMNKVALGWADAGIKTVDQAKDDAAAHSQIYYSVMKALGITGRNLVDSEVSLINKWVGEYGFDIELVKAACSKTISAIQKPSFEYTDSILANWRKKDVHTLRMLKCLMPTLPRPIRPLLPAHHKAQMLQTVPQNPKAIIQVPRINLTTSISATMITTSWRSCFSILRYDLSYMISII